MKEIIDIRFLESCDFPAEQYKIQPFTMVIFGGAGDLSRRKLIPSIVHLFKDRELANLNFSIISFGMPEMGDSAYRDYMKEGYLLYDEDPDKNLWDEFARHIHYLPADFNDDSKYRQLKDKLEQVGLCSEFQKNLIYYMAVPPSAVPAIIGKLKEFELCKGDYRTKLIVEKPFGRDHDSAAHLDEILNQAFEEDQIYRIDHYLSKEPVQNILFFRFSNFIFEQIWNRNYISNVQITAAEDIGIEHRGAFYEQTGVVRDMVQNHMLQLLAFVAMEPPVSFKQDYIRDEKTRVFRSIFPFDNEFIDKYTVRGQYAGGETGGEKVPGYRGEKNVSPGSDQPTFFAGKFYVDNLRWAGVPFFLRTGKRLNKKLTEIAIQFKYLPIRLFGRICDLPEANILIFTIQPDEKISMRFAVKDPRFENRIQPVNMVFNYSEVFKTQPLPAYERLLVDCMKSDLRAFVRRDSVEEMWRVVDPIIARWEGVPPKDFPNYTAGSWGPDAARELIEKEGFHWITS